MKALLLLIGLLTTTSVISSNLEYLIEYDFTGHGDNWYGHSNPSRQHLDYSQFTDIKSQQGDDFCNGYQANLVNFDQGPELLRTQDSHYQYDFLYTGGTRCLSFVPPAPLPNLIFSNGFE